MKKVRKQYPPEFKARVIAEVRAGAKPVEVAKAHGVSVSMVSKWVAGRGTMKVANVVKPANGNAVNAVAMTSHRDAIVFLRRGKQELMRGIKSGVVSDLDNMHLMALLALNALQGN